MRCREPFGTNFVEKPEPHGSQTAESNSMTDETSDPFTCEKYPERMPRSKRLVVILVLASMFFPIVITVFVSLTGGLFELGGTWAVITTFLAILFGWRCASVAHKCEFEQSTRVMLGLLGGGGVIAVSALLAFFLTWSMTNHIIFENESGQAIDLMVAVDQQLFIREDLPDTGSVTFASQNWSNEVSLHIDLYYRVSGLNTMTRIETGQAEGMKMKIGPEGVLTSHIPGRRQQVYPPMFVQTEAERIQELP